MLSSVCKTFQKQKEKRFYFLYNSLYIVYFMYSQANQILKVHWESSYILLAQTNHLFKYTLSGNML